MTSKIISVGQLIDDSWELYRSRFRELMSVSSWILSLAVLYALSLSLYPSASALWNSNELTGWEQLGVVLFAVTNYLLAPLLGIWLLIALTRAIRAHTTGRNIPLKTLWKETKPFFLPTLFTSLLVASIFAGAVIIGFAPSLLLEVLGWTLNNATLITLGNMLLVIGIFVSIVLSFRWMVEYMLAPYLTMLENVRGKRALVATRKLVRGRFWSTFFRLAVPKLVFFTFGILLMAAVTYVTDMILGATGGLSLDLRLRTMTLIQWIMPVVIAMLINPLMITSDILLYQALKDNPS